MRRRNKIGFSSRTFLPSMTILPEVGSIRRLTMRNRVVLPEPEVPTSIQVCPSGRPKVTASTAGLLAPGNTLVISWNAILAILLLLLYWMLHTLKANYIRQSIQLQRFYRPFMCEVRILQPQAAKSAPHTKSLRTAVGSEEPRREET